jgi:hypothetical protein
VVQLPFNGKLTRTSVSLPLTLCLPLFPLYLSLLLPPVNDTLDEIFVESGDEEESQDIVNQVLDEIGIEISGKVRHTALYHTTVTSPHK